MNKSKLGMVGILLAGSLVFGTEAYAQQPDTTKTPACNLCRTKTPARRPAVAPTPRPQRQDSLRLKGLTQKVDSLGKRIDGVNARVDSLGRRVNYLERGYDSTGSRIYNLNERVDSLNARQERMMPRPVQRDTLRQQPRQPVRQAPRQPVRRVTERQPMERRMRLTLDGFGGNEYGLLGAAAGVGYGPFGASINYSQANNELTKQISVPFGDGRTGTGRQENSDFRFFGASGEVYPFAIGQEIPYLKYLFVGAGATIGPYTTTVQESILSSTGDTLKTERNSKSQTELAGRFFGGVNVPVWQQWGLRAFAGYDTQRGKFFGAGASYRLNARNKRK
ncbi:MAG: hypothetical protein Q8P79_00820 [Nanoarchaeota archaeon]|nr:hypothetical protein [Nanoarchaeota archaeon]